MSETIEMTLQRLAREGLTRAEALARCNLPPDWQFPKPPPVEDSSHGASVAPLVGNRAKRMAARSENRRADRMNRRRAARATKAKRSV